MLNRIARGIGGAIAVVLALIVLALVVAALVGALHLVGVANG